MAESRYAKYWAVLFLEHKPFSPTIVMGNSFDMNLRYKLGIDRFRLSFQWD
jgi:hypothetical protein